MSMNVIFDDNVDIQRNIMRDFVDPETGVHYLIYNASVYNRNKIDEYRHGGSHPKGAFSFTSFMCGITPRLNSDGSIMVDPKFASQLKAQLNPQLNPDDSRFCGSE